MRTMKSFVCGLAVALGLHHKFVKRQLVESENVVGTHEPCLSKIDRTLNLKEGRP